MLRSALKRLRSPAPGADPSGRQAMVQLDEQEPVLTLYVRALSAGSLSIAPGPTGARHPVTDGRTVFLPPVLPALTSPEHARLRYRLMAAWSVLQARTGCLALAPLPPESTISALAWYELLHGEWLDRQLAAEWPGLASVLADERLAALATRQTLGKRNPAPAERVLRWLLRLPLGRMPLVGEFVEPDSLPFDTAVAERLLTTLASDEPQQLRTLALELATRTPDLVTLVDLPPYRARIRADVLARTRVSARDEHGGRAAFHATGPERPTARRGEPLIIEARSPSVLARQAHGSGRGGRQAVQVSFGDREVPPPARAHFTPLSEAEKAGASLYPEWDSWSGRYLPDWCAVRESRARPGSIDTIERILRQHRPLVQHLKRQFEALRPEPLRFTRQFDGDDLDLAAIIEAAADRAAGLAPSEKLYSLRLQRERNIALACLVDLSGSTGAWVDDDTRCEQVIEVTRRTLVFLCEALSVLDDCYAILGFTGATRKQCQIRVIKGFDEPYGTEVKRRIAGITPGAYTRIGPAVRHTTVLLARQPARVRLLLLISDGRPNDFDGYGGRYGIEDTRRALLEARQRGIATFAVTIDAQAREYMPYMFGPYHYVVVRDIHALCTKLTELYRHLTAR